MKNLPLYLLLALMTLPSAANDSGNSNKGCAALIDQLEDISELKVTLHCLNDLIVSSHQASKPQLPSNGQPRGETEADTSTGPKVKKSRSSICHEKGSRFYEQTNTYTPYNSLTACLKSGGRLPKG